MTLDQLFVALKDGGTLFALFLFSVGGLRQWWVWGWQYREMRIERDQWKALALSGTLLASRAVTLADKVTLRESLT
jgi:hypothetical protein